MKEEVLGMEHVTYTEDGQLLLEQFHMRIFRGEIMGIVCDDNRGKGALTKILQLNHRCSTDGFISMESLSMQEGTGWISLTALLSSGRSPA